MCILFDQGTPAPLRNFLPDHTIETAFERGWSELSNGNLLRSAEDAGFELLITTDQNLRYQQNLSDRRIAILVLPTTRWPEIRLHTAEIAAGASNATPGSYQDLRW